MAKHPEELASKEFLLTERICRDLTNRQISFECQVLCQFDEWDRGYIDILVNSCPPSLIEVKGDHHPKYLYRAIGQLLAYSSCFPTGLLYIAVPSYKDISARFLTVLEHIGIYVWKGWNMHDGFDLPTKDGCRVCAHPKVLAIDSALDGGRAPNLVRAQYRLDQQMFAVHLDHRVNNRLKHWVSERINHSQDKPLRVGGIVGQGIPHSTDPWRQIRFHLLAAASVWRDLEHEARNVERLTFLLQEVFRDEEMGL